MPTSNTSPVNDDSFKFKINGAEYYCYFLLTRNPVPPESFDGINKSEGVLLTISSIVSMDIHENFFTPEIVGSITINNPYDYIEDEHITSASGEDYLHIKFVDYQVYKNGDVKNEQLKYSFVITDEKNSTSKTDRSNNFKTYTLIDSNFYKLNKTYPANKKVPATNETVTVGRAIIDDVFKPLFDLSSVLKTDSTKADNPPLNWSFGDHFLNQPNGGGPFDFQSTHPGIHWRYSDVLKYLLRFNYTTSETGLPTQSFLQYNRESEKYSLLPLNEYFKDNEKFTIEALGVGDFVTEQGSEFSSTNKNNPQNNPNIKFNKNTGMLHNTDLSTPYTTYTNSYFVDYKVSSHASDIGESKQAIIRIDDIVKQWKTEFIDKFKLVGGRARPFIPFNKDTSLRPVKPYDLPSFPFKDCKNIVKAQMVSNLTFYNLQLTLDIAGDTIRRPGRFLDIFKLTENEGASDAKLLGKWFITNVHHRIIKDKYQTVVMCVKPYRGPDYDIRTNDARLDPGIIQQQLQQQQSILDPQYNPEVLT